MYLGEHPSRLGGHPRRMYLGGPPSRLGVSQLFKTTGRQPKRWAPSRLPRDRLEFFETLVCKDMEKLEIFLSEHLILVSSGAKWLEGGTREAWLLVKRLEDIGFKPDEITFEILIICGSKEGNLRCELMILLAGYYKVLKFKEAKDIVREMVTHGWISPPLVYEDPLARTFDILGLDPLTVKIKRDKTLGLLKTNFFDTLGNGLYLDTNIQECESTLMGILDEAMMSLNFSLFIVSECSVGHLEPTLKLKDAMV
ncbi:hypothetical protein AMTR_s00675p00002120 [Amborella trichopoda]|uniref:Pentatricopeptide repeat-containing protein n=1 Tax=Amborella trichopoda TaxID=13333 RepID=W1PLN7_AMBTC|nr:hypothetical protein AMTR_s00675p00002120 [Amborella trichopoda]